MWSLMKVYHLYQMIILVFSNKGHLRMVYVYLIGYGIPLVIFAITLGIIKPDGLKGSQYL